MPATLDTPVTEPFYQVGESSTPATPLPDSVRGALSRAAGTAPAPPSQAPAPEAAKPPPESANLPPEAKADAVKPIDTPAAPKHEPKELRAALEAAQSRLKEIEESGTATKRQLEAAEAKEQQLLQELEQYKPLKARLEEVEKKAVGYEERLRVIDYTQHPEFHEKYVKPVAQALEKAALVVKDYMVNGEDGARPGTEKDFEAVLAAPNGTEAVRRAKQLFGDDSVIVNQVLTERNNVLAVERARQQAFKAAALESQKAMERQQQEAAEYQSSVKTRYEKTAQELLDKDKSLYRPDPEDKEAFEEYQKAALIADDIVRGNPNKSEQDRLRELALVRHRAASYPVAQIKIQRLESQVSKLQEQLKAFQRSEPSTEGAGRSASSNGQYGESRPEIRKSLEELANRRK